MKKIICLSGLFIMLIVSGCFEITQESTIYADGSGVYSNITDMSAVIGMVKMMGGQETKDLEKLKVDTLVSLAALKDSLPGLNEKEKQLLEKASLKVTLDADIEKFLLNFSFPFSRPGDIVIINDLLKKSGKKIMGDQMGKLMPDSGKSGGDALTSGSGEQEPDLDSYFDFTYEKGRFTKKLNKEKYANVENDKSLKSLQEMGQMGSPMKLKTILNLPKPAKKAEGAGIQLSEDKKKVTIEATIDDFFENPAKFEYVIEY